MTDREGGDPGGRDHPLSPAQDRHGVIFERANQAITIVQEGHLRLVNPKTCEVSGYSREELLGAPLLALVEADDRAGVAERMRRLLLGEPSAGPLEFRLVRKDGAVRWLEGPGVPISWEGRPALLALLSDVTERKRADEALRESERLMEKIANATPHVVYIYDLDKARHVFVNRHVEEAWGYTPEEFCSLSPQGLRALFDAEDVARLADAKTRWAGVRDGQVLEHEVRLRHPSGYLRWFSCRDAIFRRSADGSVKQILGTALDVTEGKRHDEALLERQRLEGLGVLAGGLAHDFNNLLVAILGNAELALRELPAVSGVRGRLGQISVAARRAAELTSQLLAYAGQGGQAPEPMDLSEVVRSMSMLLDAAVAKKATLRYELSPGLPPVEGNPSQVRQVVTNMVINASEALGEGPGTITVRTGHVDADRRLLDGLRLGAGLAEGRYACLEIKDTGCGMDATTMGRAFDPLFSTKSTGRGFGLVAVQGIVRSHEGAFGIESTPGHGSTFSVLFPTIAVEGLRAQTDNPGALEEKATVLVVDDEPSVLEVAADLLAAAGYEVLTAGSGHEALAVFRSRPEEVDAVLLDLLMPEMRGDEVVRELRALRSDVPILLSSGYDEAEVRARLAGMSVDGFIHKPYEFRDLADAVGRALDR